jgi:hypothetical protein
MQNIRKSESKEETARRRAQVKATTRARKMRRPPKKRNFAMQEGEKIGEKSKTEANGE